MAETRQERRARERAEAKEEKLIAKNNPKTAQTQNMANQENKGEETKQFSRRDFLRGGVVGLVSAGIFGGIVGKYYRAQVQKTEEEKRTIAIQLKDSEKKERGLEDKLSIMQKLTEDARITGISNPGGRGGILYIIGQAHIPSSSNQTQLDFYAKNKELYSDLINVLATISSSSREELLVINENQPGQAFSYNDQNLRHGRTLGKVTQEEIRNAVKLNPSRTPAEIAEYLFPEHFLVGGIMGREDELLKKGKLVRAEREELAQRYLTLLRKPMAQAEREGLFSQLYENLLEINRQDIAVDSQRSQVYLETTLEIMNERRPSRDGVIVIGQLHLPEMLEMYRKLPTSLTRNRTLITLEPKSLDSLEELDIMPDVSSYLEELARRKTLGQMPGYTPK